MTMQNTINPSFGTRLWKDMLKIWLWDQPTIQQRKLQCVWKQPDLSGGRQLLFLLPSLVSWRCQKLEEIAHHDECEKRKADTHNQKVINYSRILPLCWRLALTVMHTKISKVSHVLRGFTSWAQKIISASKCTSDAFRGRRNYFSGFHPGNAAIYKIYIYLFFSV